jgi:hypothetical protein
MNIHECWTTRQRKEAENDSSISRKFGSIKPEQNTSIDALYQ